MMLTSSHYIGHEHDRMIVLFSMCDGGKVIPCAISTSAMDYLERGPQASPSSAKLSSLAYVTVLRRARGQQISSVGT